MKSQLEGAKNTLVYQEKQLRSMEQLYFEKAISEKELDIQKELVNQSLAKANSLEAQYQAGLIQYQTAKYNHEIAYMFELKKQAHAKVEQIKILLDKTSVYSPVSGVILRRHVELGEPVQLGTILFTILDPANLEITMYVPEADLNFVKTGKKVTVKVNAYPGKTFTGEIIHINDKAEFTPRNIQTSQEMAKTVFAVTVALTKEGNQLKPGMYADIILPSKEESEG